jgi:hypothetical protein
MMTGRFAFHGPIRLGLRAAHSPPRNLRLATWKERSEFRENRAVASREAQSTIRRPRISLLNPHDSPLAETEERHSRARVSANPESRNGDGGKGWIPGSGLPGPE